jgi:hypothetical protein
MLIFLLLLKHYSSTEDDYETDGGSCMVDSDPLPDFYSEGKFMGDNGV